MAIILFLYSCVLALGIYQEEQNQLNPANQKWSHNVCC